MHSPGSPVHSEVPSNLSISSPGKNNKKKARNRPPKHIRKGTTVQRKPDDTDDQSMQPESGGESASAVAEATSVAAYDAVEASTTIADNKQPATTLAASRVISDPISVPLKPQVDKIDAGVLKLEAFSSPKWLGTGFSDRMEARVPPASGHRCSEPMIDTTSGQFTYFANSMW